MADFGKVMGECSWLSETLYSFRASEVALWHHTCSFKGASFYLEIVELE